MATFYTDFSEYASDQQPAGWTRFGSTVGWMRVLDTTQGGNTGGKWLATESTISAANAIRIISPDDVTNFITGSLHTRFYNSSGTSGGGNVLLTTTPPVSITAIRWRIAAHDDPTFAAPLVDTGWVDPEYLADPEFGGVSDTAFFQTTMEPGTYLADVEVMTADSLTLGPTVSDRFTVLGFRVQFWGGFAQGVP